MDTNLPSKMLINPHFMLLSAVTEKPPPKGSMQQGDHPSEAVRVRLLQQDRNQERDPAACTGKSCHQQDSLWISEVGRERHMGRKSLKYLYTSSL